MCGILGVAASQGSPMAAVERGLLSLTHRGPDAVGSVLIQGHDSVVALGHCRLSVIDLSRDADQPMCNGGSTVWVAYNGEIYNHLELRRELEQAGHRFRSLTDTEVLVHLYDHLDGDLDRMLQRLRGMFAFALVDPVRGLVILARDRLGIKPMYWASSRSGLVFGSEVGAIAATGLVSTDPNQSALAEFLLWGTVPGPATILDAVHELPPGSLLRWRASGQEIRRWWRPVFASKGWDKEGAELALRDTLTDAIRRHRIADRPIGAFLSSGVDSAAVVQLASQIAPIRALTVAFPGYQDESAQAAAMARSAGAEHLIVEVTGRGVSDDFRAILRAMDQPTADGFNTWLVCRAAKQAGLVVALSGLGGDELFGGYSTFRNVPTVARVQRMLRNIPRPLRLAAAGVAAARTPGGRLARILAMSGEATAPYQAVRGLFSPSEISTGAHGVDGHLEEVWTSQGWGHAQSSMDVVSMHELLQYLPNQLLRDTDQMSMAHSLEVRVPLLDDEVVRLVLGLPDHIRTMPGKALLAQAANLGYLPVKRPFTLPFASWIREDLRDDIRGGVLSDDLPFDTLLPAAYRRRVWDAFMSGRTHWSRPWAIAVLRLWPQVHGLSW
ncbi:MAG: asparagine synthase (glutamine-hydrolyzing) [Acidimicrobiales bacterium]